jgi:uncharacterized SAM-binding protein YcdF (DUF218 family)
MVCATLPGIVLLWLSPKSALARRYLILVCLAFAAASVLAVGYGAGRLLTLGQQPFQAADVPPGPRAVLVLGSGAYAARDWDGNQFVTIDPHAASRVLEAARVFRLVDPEWVISSGGLTEPADGRVPSGESMRVSLVALGIPEARIVVDTNSANTHDEAVAAVPLLQKLGVTHLVLVTSELHMRRSLGAFRAQGIRAIPAVARVERGPLTWVDWLVPSSAGLYESSLVAHEGAGIAVYAWRGWYR